MELSEIYAALGISSDLYRFGEEAEKELKSRFEAIDETAEYNQMKVLKAFEDARVGEAHFASTTGYGYNDEGRDKVEEVYAGAFHAESALVRPQLMSGTHALTVALSGNLRPGDELLSPVGRPYDTLQEVIGIRPSTGSLAEYGVTYRQVELKEDGGFDYEAIRAAISKKTRMVTIQRSRGYDMRPTLSVEQTGDLIAFIKGIRPDIICMVDNCYGEFTERTEPTDAGADLAVGSLIKNPGGGLAPVGGYIVGKKEYVDKAAFRLSAPGLGREVGASLGLNAAFLEGFFLAPVVTAAALKGAIYAADIFERLGFKVRPQAGEERYDIVQEIDLGTPEGLIAFCKGIQSASPVDSFVTPEPWDMPGYDVPVIMAAGAFVQGSSIELSADGPLKPPYAVYLQGGLTWYHARAGVLKAAQNLISQGFASLPHA